MRGKAHVAINGPNLAINEAEVPNKKLTSRKKRQNLEQISIMQRNKCVKADKREKGAPSLPSCLYLSSLSGF
jgi:hypothetical protein